jgi:hypothetical protein
MSKIIIISRFILLNDVLFIIKDLRLRALYCLINCWLKHDHTSVLGTRIRMLKILVLLLLLLNGTWKEHLRLLLMILYPVLLFETSLMNFWIMGSFNGVLPIEKISRTQSFELKGFFINLRLHPQLLLFLPHPVFYILWDLSHTS